MSIKQIVEDQIEHQESLGNTEFDDLGDRMDYIRDTCVALNIELAEFMQELPWKPWRATDDQVFCPNRAAGELADVFIFAINLWITLGQYGKDDAANEFVQLIKQKQAVNRDRVQQNYNTRRR